MISPGWQRARDWAAHSFLLRVPRNVGCWTLAAYATFFAAFCISKAFRFPAVTPEGVFETDYAHKALASATLRVWDSDLSRLLVFASLLAVLLVRFRPRTDFWKILLALGLASYCLPVAGAFATGEPAPLYPFFLKGVVADARAFAVFFWRDACVAALACVPVYLLLRRASAGAYAVAGCYAALILILNSVDAAFFVTARAQLSAAEIRYFFTSPIDAAKAGRDGWSADLLLPLALPWLAALGGAAMIALPRLRRRESARTRSVALGPWLYATLACSVAAPAAPVNPRAMRFTDNFISRGMQDLVTRPLLKLAHGSAQRRSATLDLPAAPDTLQALGPGPRRNVILILMESTRPDALSSYNPAHDATPRLRELAAESLQVDDMYAVVPRTSAAWIASIAGIYPTSIATLRSWATRHSGSGFPSSLARLLAPFGYETAFFTPTHLDFEDDERVIAGLGFRTQVTYHQLDPHSEMLNSFGFTDETILPRMTGWLDARRQDGKPFFLTIMTNSGHYPYGSPRSWHKPVQPGSGALPAVYLNAVSYTDHFVGQVIDLLRSRDLLDDSMLMVMGDHGEGFLEHGIAWHAGLPYAEGLRVPALIRLPGANRRTGHVVGPRQQIDIAPTVAEVLGLHAVRGTWAGTSLLAEVPAGRTLYFGTHFDELNLGMLREGRRYVYHFGRQETETFDLHRDPGEQHSMTASIPRGDILAAEEQMQDWYDKVRANYAANRL